MSLDVYTGVFSNFSGGYDKLSTTSWDGFLQKWNDSRSGPLCLTGLDTYQENHTTTWFTGVWTQTQEISSDPCLWSVSNWTIFLEHHANCSDRARLLDFDIYPNSSWGRNFIGTWGGSPLEQVIVADLSWSEFMEEYQTLSDQGLQLAKARVYPTAGADLLHVTGLFEKPATPETAHALALTPAWSVFYNTYQENLGQMQLVDFQVCDDDNGSRWYLGIWRKLPTSTTQQLIFGQDPDEFWSQWTTLSSHGWRLQNAVRYSQQVRVPQPEWDEYFKQKLQPLTQGYAYVVMKDGNLLTNGTYGNARDSEDQQSAFTFNSRINLASISKTVTAMTILNITGERDISIDAPFWDPYMKTQVPVVGTGVENVTIRQLLNMTSGMNATFWGQLYFNNSNNYWTQVKDYLCAQHVVGNGEVYAYSNQNYLILQALIDCLLGNDGNSSTGYPAYAIKNILQPMGINITQFSIHNDPESIATLSYSTPPSSEEAGHYWTDIDYIGAAGWVANAMELVKFQQGIRKNVVLDATTTAEMLAGNLGWDRYWNDCLYGNVYHKNGALWDDTQGLRTLIVSLPFGYDVLLLTNTWLPDLDLTSVVLNAFEAQGSSSSSSAVLPSDHSLEVQSVGSTHQQMPLSMRFRSIDRKTNPTSTSNKGAFGVACRQDGYIWWNLLDKVRQKSHSFFSQLWNHALEW